MKFYKFRSLERLDWVKEIIRSGKFWCSRFYEMNDPMEGIFSFNASYEQALARIKPIYDLKRGYRICSFSGEEALSNPAMWGYYANGFKGVAIEVETEKKLKKINYVKRVPIIGERVNSAEAITILTTKLDSWEHENEYRFFTKSRQQPHRIGKVTAVYFGSPYGGLINSDTVHRDNRALSEYLRLKEQLIQWAPKNVNCYSTSIQDNKVVWQNTLKL